MAFKKASPEQAKVKAAIYGKAGSGKTFTALLFAEGLAAHDGGRIAYVDTERGTDFYAQAVKQRTAHPGAWDFDAIYTKSLAVVLREVKDLDPKVYSVVVIDSITHLWQAAMDAYDGKRVGKDKDKIPLQAWGAIKRPYKELVNFLIGSPFHVFICGRQRTVFEEVDGELKALGVSMKAEGETPYEPHVCFRMEERKGGDADATYLMHVEKDRTGMLSGRTIANPTFNTIEPILSMLGTSQAPSEDEEERIAQDGELLEKEGAKAQAKESKSGALLSELVAKAQGCTTLEELGAVRAEATKKKRQLLKEHIESLRSVFAARANVFTEAATEL